MHARYGIQVMRPEMAARLVESPQAPLYLRAWWLGLRLARGALWGALFLGLLVAQAYFTSKSSLIIVPIVRIGK